MKVKTFRGLIAWQKSMELAKRVYQITANLPDTERFGLMIQARRAAISIPSNIAEGHGRESRTDYLRFLRMARGSLMELQTQLLLIEDLGLQQIPSHVTDQLAETDRVLQGLIRGLQNLQR